TVTNVHVDNTLPTKSLVLQSVSSACAAHQTAATMLFPYTTLFRSQLQNSVSDGGSGPASAIFPPLGGTVGTWTHTAQTVNAPAGGGYVQAYNLARVAGGVQSPAESTTSTDAAGNTSNATVLTFTND